MSTEINLNAELARINVSVMKLTAAAKAATATEFTVAQRNSDGTVSCTASEVKPGAFNMMGVVVENIAKMTRHDAMQLCRQFNARMDKTKDYYVVALAEAYQDLATSHRSTAEFIREAQRRKAA